MAVIVIGRLIIALWAILVSWAGVKFHIGFTVQNRYSWGMRASYIPLLQRVLLNFIWNAVQCKWRITQTRSWFESNIRLERRQICIVSIYDSLFCTIHAYLRHFSVCITAIWPKFAKIKNTFPDGVPTNTYEFIGFVVFWFISLPFLWIPPEKFRRLFQITALYTALAMVSMREHITSRPSVVINLTPSQSSGLCRLPRALVQYFMPVKILLPADGLYPGLWCLA